MCCCHVHHDGSKLGWRRYWPWHFGLLGVYSDSAGRRVRLSECVPGCLLLLMMSIVLPNAVVIIDAIIVYNHLDMFFGAEGDSFIMIGRRRRFDVVMLRMSCHF